MQANQTIDFGGPLSGGDHSISSGTECPSLIPEIPSKSTSKAPPSPRGNEQQVIPADLTRLSDGSCVEWLRDRTNPARIRLLVRKDGRTTIQDEVQDGSQVFIPPRFTRSLSKALCLPTEILPAGDSKDRLDEIVLILRRHIQLADQDYLLPALFFLSTWFPECVEVFPYLVIVGPTNSGKTTLLKLSSCFCRRPILLGDASAASLYRLADQVAPTLLLDESEFDGTAGSRLLRRLLRMGNAGGEYVARGGQLFDGSCPKIFCVTQPIEDIALSTRAVHVAMLPSSRTLEPLDKLTLERIAAEQQSKSVMFRLEHLDRIRRESPASTQKIATFSPKLRDIARSLAVPLLGDERLESELLEALEAQDAQAVLDRTGEPAWHVVKALFGYCHPPQAGEVTVGTIAGNVNILRRLADENRILTPRKVGAILKVLGVKTMSLGNWGRGIELTTQFRRKAHELAQQFGITRSDITDWPIIKNGYGGPPCNLCTEFGLTAGLRPSPPLRERHRKHPRLFPEPDQSGEGTSGPTQE